MILFLEVDQCNFKIHSIDLYQVTRINQYSTITINK